MKNAVTSEHVAVVNFAHARASRFFEFHCAERKGCYETFKSRNHDTCHRAYHGARRSRRRIPAVNCGATNEPVEFCLGTSLS